MAMRGKNCVAIAADRRFGIQAQMVTTDFQKIFPMGDRLYIGLAGLATDVQTVWVGISSSQNVFFMPLFYLLCSESAHWFANFQLSFWKFEVKQNMLKEMKYKGKKWFFCVLSLTKWDTLTLETNFFWMMLNICDIWHSWIISQPAAGVFYDHILTVWQQLFLKGLFLLSQPVPGNNYSHVNGRKMKQGPV